MWPHFWAGANSGKRLKTAWWVMALPSATAHQNLPTITLAVGARGERRTLMNPIPAEHTGLLHFSPHSRVWKTEFNPPSMPHFSFHTSSSSPIFLTLTSLIYQAVLTCSPFNGYKSRFAFVLSSLSVSCYALKTGWTPNSVPSEFCSPILWIFQPKILHLCCSLSLWRFLG